jgi:pyruvate/2-oxoglutarate dehydrogenase complex dihydrolipoamide dehydrogenase (E3) component
VFDAATGELLGAHMVGAEVTETDEPGAEGAKKE